MLVVLDFTILDGRITSIDLLADPERLAGVAGDPASEPGAGQPAAPPTKAHRMGSDAR